MTKSSKIDSNVGGHGMYVVYDGWSDAGRRINPFGTYNRETAEKELERRQEEVAP